MEINPKFLALTDDMAAAAVNGSKAHSKSPANTASKNPLDVGADIAGSLLNYTNMGIMGVDLALPALGWGAGLIGAAGLSRTLTAPKRFMHGEHDKQGQLVKKPAIEVGKGSIGNVLFNATFVGMSALGAYGVARGFFQKVESLKQMYADMTGKDIKNISTWSLLTDKVPPMVAEARSHMIREHSTRGLIQSLGLILNGKNLHNVITKGQESVKLNMITMFGTMGADMAVDALMGQTPIIEVYKPFSDAFKRGEKIPTQAVAEFLVAASPELKKRGKVGMEVALKLGEQYAGVAPGALLIKIQNGELMRDVKHILATPQVPATVTLDGYQKAMNGEKHRPVVGDGKFTGKLQNETQSPVIGPMPA